MIAIILPTGNPGSLSPLTDSISESLLPIINKPILEHKIELLAQHNIKEIVVLLKNKPKEVKDYFGCGERWGVKLNFVFMEKYNGALNALHQIRNLLQGPFLCMQGNVLTNPDVTQLMKAHELGGSEITLCLAHGIANPTSFHWLNDDLLEKFPFIMKSKLLWQKLKITIKDLPHPDPTYFIPKINIFNCESSVRFFYLNSPKDYWETNRLVLEKKMDGLIFRGKEISKGIWVGAHSEIHPKANLKPPLVIGECCVINKDAVIENGSVIGDYSIIQEGAFVTRSIVWEGTYAGTQTQIKDSIVSKNSLFHVPRETMLKVADPFILGNSEPGIRFTSRDSKKTGSLISIIRIFAPLTRLADKFIIAFTVFRANLKIQKKGGRSFWVPCIRHNK